GPRRASGACPSRSSSALQPRSPSRHLRPAGWRCGRFLDGLDDVLVAGAAADVALEPAPDLFVGEPVAVRREQLDPAHDHPRGAEPALKRVAVPECLLERVQLAVVCEALDRRDLGAVGLHGENGAGLHRAAVEMNRASAARGGVAADLRPGEIQIVAEEIDEQRARLDLRLVPHAVDADGDGYQRKAPFGGVSTYAPENTPRRRALRRPTMASWRSDPSTRSRALSRGTPTWPTAGSRRRSTSRSRCGGRSCSRARPVSARPRSARRSRGCSTPS